MKELNHLFVIPDADRRHARREYLTYLFEKSPRKFRSALKKSLNKRDISALEERIKEFSETGEDLQYLGDSVDLLNSNKIHVDLDCLIDSYRKGGEVFDTLIKYILENNICNVLSIYGLQKKNLDRKETENFAMLKVEPEFFRRWAGDEKIYSQCDFRFVGDGELFNSTKIWLGFEGIIREFVDDANELERKSCGNKLQVNILAPYDSDWEINQAIVDGKFNPDRLIVKEPVDLIIRGGNAKMPISGGLPYQTQFAQFASVKKYFPDFTIEDFEKVLKGYDSEKGESGL